MSMEVFVVETILAAPFVAVAVSIIVGSRV